MRAQTLATIVILVIGGSALAQEQAVTGWKDHLIRQGDGKGGWITQAAQRQVLKQPDSKYTMPFGLVQMDNAKIALICSWERDGKPTLPVVSFSCDGGDTWTDFRSVPGVTGRPMNLTSHGRGKLSFVTNRRYFSNDSGRTWPESVEHPLTSGGMSFNLEGNAWVDRSRDGTAKAILELGWHYEPGKRHPVDDATVVFRRSVDGGKTWADEVTPPQWKFTVRHKEKKWLRGVSEGAIVRAANGDLVAALRTDMPPQFFDGPHDDSLEGTAISISKDDGRTWSKMEVLFQAGRHHANLQRLPNGDLVCTLVVRDDIEGLQPAGHRRGCDALVSHDHGRTWNLKQRYELDRFDYAREDGYWVDGKCGHIGAVALDDGHIISAYGHYQLGAAVLIKWKPGTKPAVPASDKPASKQQGDATRSDRSSRVAVLISSKADQLERFAADELCGYLDKLFGIKVQPATTAGKADTILLIGNPAANPAVAKALGGDGWPKVSDQGIVLKRATLDEKRVLVIDGGSPVATMWAVYELVERWGVRYLIDRDVYPPQRKQPGVSEKPGFRIPDLNLVMEPNMRIRCWRLVNDLAHGPVSWSLDENRRFLRQIAKMKYNRIHVSLWPVQPFVHYTFRGMEKPPGVLYFGQRYPIDDDTIGREKFGGMRVFTNPELVGADSPEEVRRRAIRLVRDILKEAETLGMETGLSIQPFEWPKEFMKVLPGSEAVHQLGSLTAGPGSGQSMDDPLLREMVATIVRAYIETYPNIDYIHVGTPEHRSWTGQAEKAYQRLNARYKLADLGTYEQLCAAARGRTSFPGGGGRVETMLKGDLSSIWFFDSLLHEKRLLRRPGGGDDIKIVYNGVVAELFPLLARMVPPGGEVLSFIDYTASRQLRQRELLRQVPSKQTPASLIFTLADDNVGVLPQLATGSFHTLMGDLRKNGWTGFYTRYWTVGDLDPTVHYLARASWDATLTPQQTYADQVEHICGGCSVKPAIAAFRLIERITLGLDQHGLGFGFPVPGMMTKHYRSGGLSAAIRKDQEMYRQALKQMEQAQQHSRPEGREYIDYFVGRLQFAVRYLDAADAFGATATAEKANKPDEARRHIDAAYTAIREALQAYADVAKDYGDLGAVALMNAFCYRPIRDKRSELRR